MNLRQEDMAKILNVARSTYSSYEAGTIDFPIDLLPVIANTFEVSLDYLFNEDFPRLNSVKKQVLITGTPGEEILEKLFSLKINDLENIEYIVNRYLESYKKSSN